MWYNTGTTSLYKGSPSDFPVFFMSKNNYDKKT